MEKDEKKENSMIEFLAVYGWAILVVIAAIAALVYFGVIETPLNRDNTNTTNTTLIEINETGVKVPFYQRILLIVDYNKTQCPNLAVLMENNTLPIDTVKNVTPEINFVKLGTYNTNDPNHTIKFRFINDDTGTCISRYFTMTNNDFISMLLQLGVPVANETQPQ